MYARCADAATPRGARSDFVSRNNGCNDVSLLKTLGWEQEERLWPILNHLFRIDKRKYYFIQRVIKI